ncbi:MAG: SDR family oxidoreductase [Candidatus Bathyarchaeia archaeon]
MPAKVFLTGGSGFLGAQIVQRLITQTDSQIIVLIRAASREEAVLRLKRAWWDWPELYQNIGSRIQVLNGDLTKPCLNLAESQYSALVQSITHIIHCAADTTPNQQIDKLRDINVTGTAAVIKLAQDAHANHGLDRFSHVSTAYVAGRRGGVIAETDLSDKLGFSSLYEQTKYESEQLLAKVKEDLPVSVFRPSLIVGDSKTGAVKTFNTVYYMLKQYLTGHLRFVPASAGLKLNLVPVDYVADAVTSLTFNPAAEGLTFHLTASTEKTPTAKELVQYVQDWAKQEMHLNLPNPVFIPVSPKTLQGFMRLQSNLNSSTKSSAHAYRTLAPYFNQNQTFSRENTDRLLGKYTLRWQDYLDHLLRYAVYYCFFHRSERTVHEQILYRLESKTKPIRYHEIIDGKVVHLETSVVKQEMLQAAAALKALGVQKGDVVAVIGNNSVRYLTIDVAVGLAGAVSCPLYPTSPISEINQILTGANAKLFFIGNQKILDQLSSIKTEIPIINFSRQPSSSPNVISWENFLAKAKPDDPPVMAPVEFADLATIRFTYGSTGQPKGACLEHGSLRYVAESLASNFPWKTRNTKASYLSFLPMNHVAEGITATYSPYYIATSMDFYYLEDYRNLPEALKLAKPTVLFAIPRFYEKLWATMASTSAGQQYINAKNSVKKAFLRRLVRFGLLRKAGLDKSKQLIVGAACSSSLLLQDFQNLGIEIYNAYGLSEAPLVTINRLGANNPDTVGQPLQNTQLKIAGDGEILVKGSQVMRGYLHSAVGQVFRDGWFPTGDVGEVTVQGSLKILGRKKNIIVTSYGKKVPVEHIEASLKQVPHVRDCIVVGDNQPFCCAVFWVDCQKSDCENSLDKAVEELNLTLEPPAQIKRFAVLQSCLSDSASADALKVKRQDLLKQAETVIENLYKQK